MTHILPTVETSSLTLITGGAGNAASSQAELRKMAASYCPVTYAQNKAAPTLTRAMGEKCLDEAGYGAYKGYLDRYFPKTK